MAFKGKKKTHDREYQILHIVPFTIVKHNIYISVPY